MSYKENLDQFQRLEFRDPERVQELKKVLFDLSEKLSGTVSVMHVCGSHEKSMARFGLRSLLPPQLNVIMGPGCPVCVTDSVEIDEAVYLALNGKTVITYADMLRVPGTAISLEDARARGADIRVLYSPREAVALANKCGKSEFVFFASGFETTAVATAAIALQDLPANLSILSAHKYIPPVMEVIAEMPEAQVKGFLAAGHAATITGWKIFEPFVARHQIPVVTAGFEPLDLLAALAELLSLIIHERRQAKNAYGRCCTSQGNHRAQQLLWEVFQTEGGNWRGIAHIPNGNLRLRPRYARLDARERFEINLPELWRSLPPRQMQDCICGQIMAGIASPADCRLFARQCTPETPVGACMVSNEGNCKMTYDYAAFQA